MHGTEEIQLHGQGEVRQVSFYEGIGWSSFFVGGIGGGIGLGVVGSNRAGRRRRKLTNPRKDTGNESKSPLFNLPPLPLRRCHLPYLVLMVEM